MDRLLPAVRRAASDPRAPADRAAAAIMTTDLASKTAAFRCGAVTVGGMAKGSGMIHPNMATMLGFLSTDAAVAPADLQRLLGAVVEETFNAITVDGDTSTNDAVIVQATGRGARVIPGSPAWDDLRRALTATARDLARQIAADGEGATTLIEAVVLGCADDGAARAAARAVLRSPLVKTAIHGRDPNWGRVVGALGAAEVPGLDALDLDFGGTPMLRGGRPLPFDEDAASRALDAPEVSLVARLTGPGVGRAWGCDLSADYVRINADYRS
jgi:glutamate N-acetyltransferase/amino-acid N-acetyltransferase